MLLKRFAARIRHCEQVEGVFTTYPPGFAQRGCRVADMLEYFRADDAVLAGVRNRQPVSGCHDCVHITDGSFAYILQRVAEAIGVDVDTADTAAQSGAEPGVSAVAAADIQYLMVAVDRKTPVQLLCFPLEPAAVPGIRQSDPVIVAQLVD